MQASDMVGQLTLPDLSGKELKPTLDPSEARLIVHALNVLRIRNGKQYLNGSMTRDELHRRDHAITDVVNKLTASQAEVERYLYVRRDIEGTRFWSVAAGWVYGRGNATEFSLELRSQMARSIPHGGSWEVAV